MPESELMQKLRSRAEQEQRVYLPRNFISWEYGSNKYASQKGSGGFSRIRNATLNIESSRDWIETYEVPFHICPPLKRKYANQSDQSSFGGFRNNLLYVKEHEDEEKKNVNDLLTDPKATSRIIPKLNTPNNEAKNDQIGSRRQTITHTTDSCRRLSKEEKLKCQAAIPRFLCMNETMAHKDAEVYGKQSISTTGFHSNRQIITNVSGLDRTEQQQLDSNRYLCWMGGQLTMQSQSKTAGFMKKRDVANVSYYDKLVNEAARKLEIEQMKERHQKEEFEENFTLGSTERTIPLPKEEEEEEKNVDEEEISDEEDICDEEDN